MLHIIIIILLALSSPGAYAEDGILLDHALNDHGITKKTPSSHPLIENPSIDMNLIGSGFHRVVQYKIQSTLPTSSSPSIDNCTLAILQPLPSGIYANIYELDNAASLDVGPKVKLYGPIDVENITEYAQPTVLALYSSYSTARSNNGVSVALHARYPKVTRENCNTNINGVQYSCKNDASSYLSVKGLGQFFSSPMAHITLVPPTLLLRCPEADYDNREVEKDIDTKNISPWQYTIEAAAPSSLTWVIPAGHAMHALLVTVITSLTVVASGLIVGYHLYCVPLASKIKTQ